jgi:hypothetical protein
MLHMGKLKALVNNAESFSVIRGEDVTLLFRIFDEDTKAPHPMGAGSSIEVTFPTQGELLMKAATGIDWAQAVVQVDLSAAEGRDIP